jgi:hypothetical protein
MHEWSAVVVASNIGFGVGRCVFFSRWRDFFMQAHFIGFMPPAKSKGTANHGPVTADGTIRARHEVSPPKFILHLRAALFDPAAQSIQTHDFQQGCALLGQVCREILGVQVRQSMAVCGGANSKYRRIGSIPEQRQIGRPPVLRMTITEAAHNTLPGANRQVTCRILQRMGNTVQPPATASLAAMRHDVGQTAFVVRINKRPITAIGAVSHNGLKGNAGCQNTLAKIESMLRFAVVRCSEPLHTVMNVCLSAILAGQLEYVVTEAI